MTSKNPARHHLCNVLVVYCNCGSSFTRNCLAISPQQMPCILLTAGMSLAWLVGRYATASPSSFRCSSFSADHNPQWVQSNHANKHAATITSLPMLFFFWPARISLCRASTPEAGGNKLLLAAETVDRHSLRSSRPFVDYCVWPDIIINNFLNPRHLPFSFAHHSKLVKNPCLSVLRTEARWISKKYLFGQPHTSANSWQWWTGNTKRKLQPTCSMPSWESMQERWESTFVILPNHATMTAAAPQ